MEKLVHADTQGIRLGNPPIFYAGGGGARDVQMHIFCDASTMVYAAVVYFRCTKVNGRITTRLAMARTRLASTKPITICRLEP